MNNIMDDDKQESVRRDSIEERGPHHQERTMNQNDNRQSEQFVVRHAIIKKPIASGYRMMRP